MITFEDISRIGRISTLVVHPTGDYIVFNQSYQNHITNTTNNTLMLVDLKKREVKDLLPGFGPCSDPTWSPDGTKLAFTSNRESGQQVWILPFLPRGEPWRLISGEGGFSTPVWSPDGRRIAFTRSVIVSPYWDGKLGNVKSEEKDKVTHAKKYGVSNPLSTARVETSLLFRHINHWREMKRTHLFLVDIETRRIEDITSGDIDVPPISLGGSKDYMFSPDGMEIAYIKNPDKVVARSTNNSIFIQKIDGIKIKGKAIEISKNKAREIEPKYSNDGRYLAYLSAFKPGYEADRLRIMLYDRRTKVIRNLTEDFDRSVSEYVWSNDDKKIYFLSPDLGSIGLYGLDLESDKILQYSNWLYIQNLTSINNDDFIVTIESPTHPPDIHRIKIGAGEEPYLKVGLEKKKISLKEVDKITHYGDSHDNYDLQEPEEFWFKGSSNDLVHGFLFKPLKFNAKKKYGAILLIHGGPQAAFSNSYNFSLNPYVFSSNGYAVIQLNPRGSVGFGQSFSDQISGDWGGKCYEDIMRGIDYCLQTYSYIDGNRLAAIGTSFGGFMINWIACNTDRFKVLVSHAGTFNAETRAYTTDELWFLEWEIGCLPHENHKKAQKFSPHMYVDKIKTPMLITQGEIDYRCPISQSLGLFTALQTLNVPSKLLYFPDESHRISKPANIQVWHNIILEYINDYIDNKIT